MPDTGLGAGPGDASGFGVPLELGDLSADVGPTATRPPARSSPLVDAIPLDACDGWDGLVPGPVTTDQRGVARPHGHGCDIGAVEVLERGVVRVFGPERTATAAAISARSFPTADTVFLATAFNFPDALAGGPLAAREPAPILLAGTTSLPTATRAELERLAPATLVVLGGTAAISDAVAAAAAAAAGGATIDRLAGPDRFATAAAIAERYPTADRAYLATGANFPDALTGAALAAARDDGPVLLTLRDTLPTATAAQLTRLAPDELIVLGGTGVVFDAVAQAAADAAGGAAITRLAGPDRFATAAAVANTFPAPTDVVYTATGHNFPDALTGTPAAAQTSSPILLTNRDTLPDPTITQLTRLTPLQIVILGGEGVVSAAVADTLTTHLR